MVIQPIKKLYANDGNRLTANKMRISMIKKNVDDDKFLHDKFGELCKCLGQGKTDIVKDIIVNDLFYEIIPSDLVSRLEEAFYKSKNRDKFINELKVSYQLRGVKSALFAWSPLLSRELQ